MVSHTQDSALLLLVLGLEVTIAQIDFQRVRELHAQAGTHLPGRNDAFSVEVGMGEQTVAVTALIGRPYTAQEIRGETPDRLQANITEQSHSVYVALGRLLPGLPRYVRRIVAVQRVSVPSQFRLEAGPGKDQAGKDACRGLSLIRGLNFVSIVGIVGGHHADSKPEIAACNNDARAVHILLKCCDLKAWGRNASSQTGRISMNSR